MKAAACRFYLHLGKQNMNEILETVHEARLDNGLKILVIPDNRAPIATHMLWYGVGSSDEQVGKSGIVHFLEHLMFKGTHKHAGGVFGEVVAECGGQENAFTSNDYTAYYQRIAPEHLETMMQYESDRMRGLKLSEEDVRTERDVVLEERSQRTDNNPSEKLYEMVSRELFSTHPYGIPVIGWEDEIRALNRKDAFDVYHHFYGPNNATLIVAGDVDLNTVVTLAQKTYGLVEGGAPMPRRLRMAEPECIKKATVTLKDEKVMQPQLSLSFVVPSSTTAKAREGEALEILAAVLGGGVSSKLYAALVMEEELATSAGAWYWSTSLNETRFMIYASPVEGVTLAQLETRIFEIIGQFTLDESELARAKTRLVADSIYAQDKQSTLAQIYGAALTTGLSVKDVQEWPARIRAITAQDVLATLPLLNEHRAVAGHLLAN
jgi:zinc protease